MKLSSKVIAALQLLSKCLFSLSKLRFSGYTDLEIPLVYTTSNNKGVSKKLVRHSLVEICSFAGLFENKNGETYQY